MRIGDFRFADWALIRETTGLDAERFVLAHHDDSDAPPDPLVMWGYAAVAYWHGNTQFTRERAALEASEWGPQAVQYQAAKNGEPDPPTVPVEPDGSGSSGESSET